MKKHSFLMLPLLLLATVAQARSAWLDCGPREQSIVSIQVQIQEDGRASLNPGSLNGAPVQLHFLPQIALTTESGPLPESFPYNQEYVVSMRKNVKLSAQGTVTFGLYRFQNTGIVERVEGPIFLATRILKNQSIDIHSERVKGAAEVTLTGSAGQVSQISCDFWIPWN